MATELRLGGVDELLAELARLAPDLAADARSLQTAIAEETAAALRAAYPVVSGELAGSVRVDTGGGSRSPARVFAQVVVDAPHAEFVEFGTARMAPAAIFVPRTRRAREHFVTAVVARVRAAGLTVAGVS